jgi:mRNA interferase MazF
MSRSRYVPERGDVVWLQLDPQVGHDQAGRRPALTISPASYNGRVGLGVFCPVTNRGKGYPFEVPVPAGKGVTGVVMSDQMKSLDWRGRRAEFLAKLDEETVLEVVGRYLPLIDPDEMFGGGEADAPTGS